jgi:hypothetical protein
MANSTIVTTLIKFVDALPIPPKTKKSQRNAKLLWDFPFDHSSTYTPIDSSILICFK